MKSSKRKCHDCGAPTTDYRCPSCWNKHLKKNGIISENCRDDVTLCHVRKRYNDNYGSSGGRVNKSGGFKNQE